jgi:anthranilate synthase component 1
VFREVLADTETPVSILERLADEEHVFLLESVEGGERWGRYSFIGLAPEALFCVENGVARLTRLSAGTDEILSDGDEGFMALRRVLAGRRVASVPGAPRFLGGAVGFASYETVSEFEQIGRAPTASGWPDSLFMLTETLVVFDNVRHTILLLSLADTSAGRDPEEAYREACDRVLALGRRLGRTRSGGVITAPAASLSPASDWQANMSRERFEAMVSRARGYIEAGDVIQVVLSQRFSRRTAASALDIYRALRYVNPSPYTFFLRFGNRVLVGGSPEMMVRREGDRICLRPIAGTRPRGTTEQEDRALADELLADERERAEHVMLVDLGRNDLGRVSVAGSVQVRDFMTIERYSHVMHIVSQVEAVLQPDLDSFDLFRATFPAGTVSGAPKVRAMEIVAEQEPTQRGPYAGALGYVGYDGNMDMAITIRTLLMDGDRASAQAGAGIVYDSVPEREYRETLSKAASVMRAVELAESGLDLAASGR